MLDSVKSRTSHFVELYSGFVVNPLSCFPSRIVMGPPNSFIFVVYSGLGFVSPKLNSFYICLLRDEIVVKQPKKIGEDQENELIPFEKNTYCSISWTGSSFMAHPFTPL